LAAQRIGQRGVDQFEEATRSNILPEYMKLSLSTEAAGLRLLAGDDSGIREVLGRIHVKDESGPANSTSLSPKVAGEMLARVGHWYYESGKYDEALKQFNAAQELSPALPGIAVEIGWAALQTNKIQTAQSSFQTAYVPETIAGMAVSMWRSEDRDGAVSRMSALVADSRWRNERWLSSTYGPTASKTIAEIETERQHRLKAKK
jgi:tetratricopeptide (TPR) repeat protein